MFSSHYEGPGPSLFAPKIVSGTRCALETLFFPSSMPTLGGKVGPKFGKVGPKVAPREPKGPKRSPKASPGTPKNH